MNAERLRQNIRQHPALWGEMGPEKEEQAERLLRKTAERLRAKWNARAEAVRHAYGQRILSLYA